MAVQLTIEFETLVELVNQLKPTEQQVLMRHLQEKASQEMLNNDEFRVLFNSLMIDRELITPDDSLSREDLYGDDGR